MTAKEILERHFYSPDKEDIDAIIKAMKEFAIYCCEKQKQLCLNNATARIESYDEPVVNKYSILNSPLPEELL